MPEQHGLLPLLDGLRKWCHGGRPETTGNDRKRRSHGQDEFSDRAGEMKPIGSRYLRTSDGLEGEYVLPENGLGGSKDILRMVLDP